MRTLLLSGLVMVTALASVGARADVCGDIVADTVAELRAGATDWWSDEIEGLVREAESEGGEYVALEAGNEEE